MKESAVYTLLSDDTTVATLTGGRVYTQEPNENTPLPYVVISRDDSEPLYTLGGRGSPDRITILVDVWSDHYDSAKQVLTAVKAALHGFRGQVDDVLVFGLFHSEDLDQDDAVQDGKFHLVGQFNLFA